MSFNVLTCLYRLDCARYFEIYLDDILQSRVNLSSVVLVIDGPIDSGLEDIVSQLATDPLFRIFRLKKNLGLVSALNYGLSQIPSGIVVRCDPDDRLHSNRLSELKLGFVAADVSFIFNNSLVINDVGENVGYISCDQNRIFFRNPFVHSGSAYRVEIVKSLGGYRDIPGFEDYDLWLRAFSLGYGILVINKPLTSFRVTKNFVSKRSGYKYFLKEWFALTFFLRHGLLPFRVLPFWCLRLFSRFLPISLIKILRR